VARLILVPYPWPEGFARVPDEDWARQPVETLARKYDTVQTHGWYRNLEPTVDDLAAGLAEGQVLLDYSGGTGILVERLLARVGNRPIGIVIADSSPKFLRQALEKLRGDDRVAFRLIRYLKEAKRLQWTDEVIAERFDALSSTNAIHLYYDLPETVASWRRVLRAGALAHIQSGNMGNPRAKPGEWIIDQTVDAIHEAALEIVRESSRFARYRERLADAARMAAYTDLRRKYFLPVRPLDHYVGVLDRAGLVVEGVKERTIEARVDEWRSFVSVYHEGVLGWVGGVEKIEGRAPTEEAVADRLELIGLAMERVFSGRAEFPCCWTYIRCRAA